MKNIFLFITILLLGTITGCNKKNDEFKFYICDFKLSEHDDPFNYNKWIDNKKDALEIKLAFYDSELNKRNLDSLYKQTSQYLFIIGGGGIWVKPEYCSAEINNDRIIIKYKIKVNSGPVGEAAATPICMEIDKRKYPNYKKMKIIYLRK